jgi:hypothetical protein
MPLSTVLGAQSLVQPAVCTTATRPASPYTGQAIYDTTISALLVWNGTAWTGTGGLQLVTTATCSSGGTAVGGVVTIGSAVSSVTVATAFSSTYENYKVTLSGGTCSIDDEPIGMILGATTTGYYASYVGTNFSATSLNAIANNNASSWTRVGAAMTNGLNANFDISAPNLAKWTTINGAHMFISTARVFAGNLQNTTAYTAFTLTPTNGTMTGGIIRVYGYSNS